MIDFYKEKSGRFYILRDDTLPGGTKRRTLNHLLKSYTQSDFYYAGTTMGHGALALVHACHDNNKQAHIYICGDNDHPMIEKIRKAGAYLHIEPPCPITALYETAKQASKDAITFPPGFDMPEFEDAMMAALQNFDAAPYSEIWTCAVTGTLTRALKRAFADKVFKTVAVAKSTPGDFHTPEKYHQPAKFPPPYPSCPYTDAKVWQFACEQAQDGALIWNTAG